MRESDFFQIKMVSAGVLSPVYFAESTKLFFIGFFALMFHPVSRGFLDGWCIIATGRNSQ